MNPHRIAGFALLLLVTVARVSPAAWPHSYTVNLPVVTASGNQLQPVIVPDGAGGAIVGWLDERQSASYRHVYAQHVLATGTVDPGWPVNGTAVCLATDLKAELVATSDGAGGAIFAWQETRGLTGIDIYAHHVLASGIQDPAWPRNGRAVCTASNSQTFPAIVSDGAGGAIIAWQDMRAGATADLYAHHVLAAGTLDPAWPTSGAAFCTAANDQVYVQLASDGAGGAIAAWQDTRSGGSLDVYAQRVLAAGTVDPAWPADGRALCTADGLQYVVAICAAGDGGAYVAWMDGRNGNYDIYAQRVAAAGTIGANWPADGAVVCNATGDQTHPKLVPDDAGGFIAVWDDARGGGDVLGLRVLPTGQQAPGWSANGSALSAATGNQSGSVIAPDGAGGVIAAWEDNRSDGVDIYAGNCPWNGSFGTLWWGDGLPVSVAPNSQLSCAIASDGEGGAIVAWEDERAGVTDANIYAQRIARFGVLGTPEAEIAGVDDVPYDQGGEVKVSWNASWLDLALDARVAAYDVYRSVPPNAAAAARAAGLLRTVRAGDRLPAGAGAPLAFPAASTSYAWEWVGTATANHFASRYSLLASTAFDSTAAGNPATAFLVLARNADGSAFWPSRPDSGYSVDNLPPPTPAPFTGHYAAGATTLAWGASAATDLAGYRLYRGASAVFAPGPGNLVTATSANVWVDPAGTGYFYKLTAMDVHGNESAPATLQPAGTTDAGGPPTHALALAPASPNPANLGTTLHFALPAEARVTLAIYDAAGRLVRTLASGPLPAGEHAAGWDLRDETGRTVTAGLYFARLEAAGRTLARRIAVTP